MTNDQRLTTIDPSSAFVGLRTSCPAVQPSNCPAVQLKPGTKIKERISHSYAGITRIRFNGYDLSLKFKAPLNQCKVNS